LNPKLKRIEQNRAEIRQTTYELLTAVGPAGAPYRKSGRDFLSKHTALKAPPT